MVRANSWFVVLFVSAAAATAHATPATETFTTVQLRFACAPAEAPIVELAASFETKVALPRGCPGGSLSLRLACDAQRCLGVAHFPGAAETRLEGPRARVVAVNLPSGAPITLAGFQLEALKTRKQQLTDSYLSLAMLSVRVATKEPLRETWFRVRPEEAFWLSFAPDSDSDAHALQLVVHRRSRGQAQIDGWLRSGEKVIGANLPVGGSTELSCRALSQPCKATLELRIDEE